MRLSLFPGWVWVLMFLCRALTGGAASDDPAWGAAWATQSAPSRESLLKATEAARAASLPELERMGADEAVFIDAWRPKSEWTAWRLGHLYRISGDKALAARAAALLAGLAARPFPGLPAVTHLEGNLIPFPAVIAYALVREAPVWREDGVAGAPERAAVDAWLHAYARAFFAVMQRPGQITNYTPYGLRHAASLALVLGDPALLERCAELAETLAWDPDFWYADLIWQEDTVSYARQVTGNLRALIPMLRAGADSGLARIDPAALDRLAGRLREIDAAQAGFTMPSGRPIPVNDTHWTVPRDAVPRAPRAIIYPDSGHYAIPGPDLESHLSAPPLTGGGRYGGGHYHDSRLSLQLWAHGQELLPDAGYPFNPANNRYFHASPLAHNMAVADAPGLAHTKGPYGVWGGDWARTALLGYDDGPVSGGRVSYVAASSPGPEREGIRRAERALLQVATGPRSGYVLDVFWLQGGRVHESYLRQTEDEAAAQTVSAPLRRAGGTMAEVLGGLDKGGRAWRALLREPDRVETTDAFEVTWTGKESGVALRLFLAPQPGSTTWISRMPRLRPTGQDPAKRDDFPGWHLYRRRLVEPSQVTAWAALYEPVANGAAPLIRSVRWRRSADGAGLLVTVELPGRTDRWLLGLPDQPVVFDGMSLRGRAAGCSTGERESWRWAAAGSELRNARGEVLAGGEPCRTRVRRLVSGAGGRELVLEKAQPRPANGWFALRFSDGAGRGVKVGEPRAGENGESIFPVLGDPGMVIDARGVRRTAFPLREVPGEVWAEPLGAVFSPGREE